MCFSGPSIPPAQKPPPTATPSDPAVVAALDRERRRQMALGGRQSTILGGADIGPSTTGVKTLVGQ